MKFTYGGVAWIKKGGGVSYDTHQNLGWFSCLRNSFCCNIKKISVVKLKFEIRIQENCLILEYQVQVYKLYIICSIQGAS